MYVAKINFSGRISQRSLNEYSPILDYVERKKKISGLILVINSGGGDAASSQLLFNRIRKIDPGSEFLIIQALQKFLSNKTLILITHRFSLISIVDRIGVRVDVDKIGKYKDMNSPFGEPDKESAIKYHEILKEIFSVFRDSVKERRRFTDDEITGIATGEVFAPRKAKSLRLIDEIGDSEAALEDMSRAYGTGKKTRTFGPRRSLVSRVIGMDFFTSMRDSIMEMFLSEY